MIDLTIHRQALDRNIQKAREGGVVIPTFENMKHPETVPEPIRARLRGVGLWDVDPLNLFRITWKNEPMESGGLYRAVPNYIELPPALTGVPARIIALVGKWFPTGCHKVGASFGCLAPRLVTGQFDAGYHRAVWPSTGNYCRGGAFNSKLLGVRSVAILPAGMSRERFEWLSQIAGEVIATPGCESNVKEIFDKTHELRQEPDCMIFNQFEEMGNHLWHYQVTGSAIAEVFEAVKRPGDRLSGACFTSGSAGTIGCGDYLKEVYPGLKLAVGEALQCPTILENGFGDHRIEGIGDKHIPWIHNVKNTDMVIDMYRSRIQELADQYGPYDGRAAAVDHALHLLGLRTDAMAELNYYDRKRVHNLKYYTWVEQQGRDMHELNDLWYGSTWDDVHRQAAALDELITAFNEETGVLKRL